MPVPRACARLLEPPAISGAADFCQFGKLFDFHGGDGDNDLFYVFVVYNIVYVLPGAQYGYAVQDLFLFGFVVIDEAYHLAVVTLPQVPQDRLRQ